MSRGRGRMTGRETSQAFPTGAENVGNLIGPMEKVDPIENMR
jgi:hypothetical protein